MRPRPRHARVAKRITLTLLMLACAVGCVRRSGRNSNCNWPGELDAKKLDLRQWRDRWHLRRDAEFAEDLAIRYGDAHYGLRSGHFESQQAYTQAIHSCGKSMFGDIANAHGVTVKQVSDTLRSSRIGMDFVLNLPFILAYLLASGLAIGYISRRYPFNDGWIVHLAVLALGSAIFGFGAIFTGDDLVGHHGEPAHWNRAPQLSSFTIAMDAARWRTIPGRCGFVLVGGGSSLCETDQFS